jgi:hypothetical protein
MQWGGKCVGGGGLGLIGRVLSCPGSCVVPGEGWRLHIFFFKIVKEVHTCHDLSNIGCILCGWVRSEGNDTINWKCLSHPQRGYIHGVHSRCHSWRWSLSGAHPLRLIPGKAWILAWSFWDKRNLHAWGYLWDMDRWDSTPEF